MFFHCRYEVLQCGDIEKLIKKCKTPVETPVYYVSIGGRDTMTKYLADKYANITRDALKLFKSYCAVCHAKSKRPVATCVVVRPIISHDFNSRGQVDLVDMQSKACGSYKWIMVYQCHLTKFVIIRPLTTKRASEVSFQLLDICLLFDAPVILQSDNGSEFTAGVIKELKVMWPQLTMVHVSSSSPSKSRVG